MAEARESARDMASREAHIASLRAFYLYLASFPGGLGPELLCFASGFFSLGPRCNLLLSRLSLSILRSRSLSPPRTKNEERTNQKAKSATPAA